MTELYTLPEAAQRLRVSESTVRRLIRSGDIQAIKIRGCAPRVLPASIAAYVERLAGAAQNPECAGQAMHNTEREQCQSANQRQETKTASTKGRTAPIGGAHGQNPAAARLAARLGLM